MAVDYVKVKKIFLDVLEQPPGQNRQDFIEEACGDDIDLRNFVMGMLGAHEKHATPIPEGPTKYDAQAHANEPALTPGTILAGKYKIIELIAEGGMGSVYRASRIADMKMEVAIKVIKPGMDSQQVLARFNIERQALAIMKHENIARVLDAGMTDQRLPFIVMELVKGLTLTKFCDESKLSVEERLELFEKICSAVQHAHQKGIVHRDLKPNNILVALFDDKPVPKVIDFGLAKALHQPLTDDDLRTRFGMFVGTWQYTAPEQAQLNNLDIDTRADIYSLGVILYELLTGSPPLDKQRIIHAAHEEVLRLIREEEPQKPSTRIHSSDQLPSIAALRHTEPAKLERQIRGELDWIVMKALDKDRNRRYTTANEFSKDINAYLHGDHVTAAPPSAMYKLKCFYRKHRGKILTAAAMAILLIAGIVSSTIGFIQARRSEHHANEQLATANALIEFVDRGMFSPIDPNERARLNLPMESNILVRDMLARSAASVEKGAFKDQPRVELKIRHTLGKAFYAIGLLDQAATQLSSAETRAGEYLGKESEERLLIVEHIGDVLSDKGNYQQAKEQYEEAMQGWTILLGKNDLHVLKMRMRLLQLELGQSGQKTQEEYQKIEGLIQTLLDSIVKTNDNVLRAQMELLHGEYYVSINQLDKSKIILQSALTKCKQSLPPEHPDALAIMNTLAGVMASQDNIPDAEAMYLDLLGKAARVYDADNAILALFKNNYAELCVRKQDYKTAEKLFRESLAVFQKMSPKHPYTLSIMANVPSTIFLRGDFAGAYAGFEEIMPIILEASGQQSEDYQTLLRDAARALIELKRKDDAVVQLKKLAKIAGDSNGKQKQHLLIGLKEIRKSLIKNNKKQEFDEILVILTEYLRQIPTTPLELIDTLRSLK